MDYEPKMVVNTALLTRKEWEKMRNIGIGGSEGAAIVGKSKFQTNIDVWNRKLGKPEAEADEFKSFLFDCGHAMEPLVAQAFQIHHPDWKVEVDTKMYQHPLHPCMIADVDRIGTSPSGEHCIIECKFVTYEGRYTWTEPPEYYVIQVQHYLSVMNMDCGYLCVLWGNNPYSDYTEFKIYRDADFESKYIDALEEFWTHVEDKTRPTLAGGYAESILKTIKANFPTEDESAHTVLAESLREDAYTYAVCQKHIADLKKEIKETENTQAAAQARIVAALDGAGYGELAASPEISERVEVSNLPTTKNRVDTALLAKEFPEVYAKVAKFSATLTDLKKASPEAYARCVVTEDTGDTKFKLKIIPISKD